MIALPRLPAAVHKLLSGLLALASLGAGLTLALAYPLSPWLAVLGFAAVLLLSYCRPSSWLFFVPALLPLANGLPWTGWLIFDEFDLLLLAVIAGAYGARSLAPDGGKTSPHTGLSRHTKISPRCV